MIILLNKYSNNGAGLKKWKYLRNQLEKKYIQQDYTVVSQFEGFDQRLQAEFDRGERILIAAGGDGTVNFLLNSIMKMKKNNKNRWC